MKSTITTLFIIGSLLLILFGGSGYIKSKINLRRHSYNVETLLAHGYDVEAIEKKIKRSNFNSAIMVLTGGLGLFIIISNANKPVKKQPGNYKS